MTQLDSFIHEAAKSLLTLGLSVIPIGHNKIPATSWKDQMERPMDPGAYDFPDCNLGIVTGAVNQLVVVDCDSVESYTGWLKYRPRTPMRVRSKRGIHFWYRHPGGYIKSDSHIEAPEGFEYDVKGDKSYVMIPPSLRDGHQYQICVCRGNIAGELIHPSKLPVFDPAWRPERAGSSISMWNSEGIRNIRSYLASVQAIEGCGGDKTTYKVCCKLKESGLPEAEAMALLAEWNSSNCSPPWDISQLYRKLNYVYSHSL